MMELILLFSPVCQPEYWIKVYMTYNNTDVGGKFTSKRSKESRGELYSKNGVVLYLLFLLLFWVKSTVWIAKPTEIGKERCTYCKPRQLGACRLQVNWVYKFLTSYNYGAYMMTVKAEWERHKTEVDGENTMVTFNKH